MGGADDLFSKAPALTASPDDESILHASCVADGGRAVLIRGASGRGKSALALQLMAYGAQLVADDQTVIRRFGEVLLASAPEITGGLIEARGVGILKAAPVRDVAIKLVVDLDQVEDHRLPHPREVRILDQTLPLIFAVDAPHFAAAVLQLVRHGRNA